jgi:hypothetical protein
VNVSLAENGIFMNLDRSSPGSASLVDVALGRREFQISEYGAINVLGERRTVHPARLDDRAKKSILCDFPAG